VTAATRLAEIITALEAVGVSCLVMGGHAVRYYGLERTTVDFDLHLSPDRWDELPRALAQSSLARGPTLVEGPTWRPNAFRRFQIGWLPDGREEWLEFWSQNHLLAPYPELFARREEGTYGGRVLPFLSLPDLIRSKETERLHDWQDVRILEEFLDARLLAQVGRGVVELELALSHLRSRRGFESYLEQGLLNDSALVARAVTRTRLSITHAYLLPLLPTSVAIPAPGVPMEPVVLERLRKVAPGSPLHLSLVEIVRRQYMGAMQAADRADKQAIRASQTIPPGSPP
jgi:hypothetical protein